MFAPRPASSDADDAQRGVAALDLAPLEVHEQRRPLRRILRRLRQLSHQPGNPVADGHRAV